MTRSTSRPVAQSGVPAAGGGPRLLEAPSARLEVGGVHPRVGQDSAERAVGDDLAGVHHHHPVGDRLQQLDPVLDDDHRDVQLLGQDADQVVDLVDLGIDQPGRRLVHQQELGPPHQQAGQQQLAAVERVERVVGLVVGRRGSGRARRRIPRRSG